MAKQAHLRPGSTPWKLLGYLKQGPYPAHRLRALLQVPALTLDMAVYRLRRRGLVIDTVRRDGIFWFELKSIPPTFESPLPPGFEAYRSAIEHLRQRLQGWICGHCKRAEQLAVDENGWPFCTNPGCMYLRATQHTNDRRAQLRLAKG